MRSTDEKESHTMSVLKTKLHKPFISDNHIIRSSIIERLEKNLHKPFTLVSAAAGYGKSVTVSQWLDHTRSNHAWLSLDEEHNELWDFLAYLVAAVRQVWPEAMFRTKNLFRSAEQPPLAVVAHTLINDLDQVDEPFVLVLDDYHRIRKVQVHQLINELLRFPPGQLHLVMITRSDPPLKLGRLKGQLRLHEIRMADLSFTVAEAAALSRQMAGLEVPAEKLSALMEHTEGWVTGLSAALFGMGNGLEIDTALRRMRSDLSRIAEFLSEDVIGNLPEFVQNGVMATAILDRFCSDLAGVMLANGEGSGPPVQEGLKFIQFLRRSNLFLITLDEELEWFRYHHFFREFLMNQLAKRQSAEQIAGLYKKAGRWFEQQGFPEEAIPYNLKGNALPSANEVVARRPEAFKKDKQRKAASMAGNVPASSAHELASLSDRELEILRLVAERYRNNEIAGHLYLSLDTIKKYLYHAYQKLGVKNRMSAIKKARELGLIVLI